MGEARVEDRPLDSSRLPSFILHLRLVILGPARRLLDFGSISNAWL